MTPPVFRFIQSCFVLLALTLCSSQASAVGLGLSTGLHAHIPQSDKRITWQKPTLAPFGHVKFCMSYPQDCQDQGSRSSIHLDEESWALMNNVNLKVNRSIQSKSEEGTDDVWQLMPRLGDCEDYAISKRHSLIEEGWPSSKLLLALARIPDGRYHTVLVVKTDRGDLILDNLSNQVRTFSQVNYQWLKLQSASNPQLWNSAIIIKT